MLPGIYRYFYISWIKKSKNASRKVFERFGIFGFKESKSHFSMGFSIILVELKFMMSFPCKTRLNKIHNRYPGQVTSMLHACSMHASQAVWRL
jgi:hypothetical protein